MTYNPNLPIDIKDPSFGRKVSESSRLIWERFNELNTRYIELEKKMKEVHSSQTIIVEQINQVVQPSNPSSNGSSQSSSPSPLSKKAQKQLLSQNIQSFQGQLNQVQLAGIPDYLTLPSTKMIGNDPNLQDTSLIRVGQQLYVVDQPNLAFIELGVDIVEFETIQSLVLLEQHIDTTQVSVNANVTTDQDLMSFTIPANTLNVVGKILKVHAYGTLDEDSGPNVQFKFFLGSTAILDLTPNTPATTKTALGWTMEVVIATVTTGATGTIAAHGWVAVDSGATGSVGAPQIDKNADVLVPTFDLTGTLASKFTIAFSTGSTNNVGRQRMGLYEY